MILQVACFFLVLCSAASPATGNILGRPQNINVEVLQGGDGQCPSTEERERERNKIRQSISSLISETLVTQPIEQRTTALPTADPTYTCSGSPGWRLVTFINMTDISYNCPSGLTLTSYSKRTCGRSNPNQGCSSTTFSVGGAQYSRVCGRIRGYQFGPTSAFYSSNAHLSLIHI